MANQRFENTTVFQPGKPFEDVRLEVFQNSINEKLESLANEGHEPMVISVTVEIHNDHKLLR